MRSCKKIFSLVRGKEERNVDGNRNAYSTFIHSFILFIYVRERVHRARGGEWEVEGQRERIPSRFHAQCRADPRLNLTTLKS